MDHLPHPQDAAFLPVVVPYYDKYKYDGGSFTDYPVRCGFDKMNFIWGDFSTVPSNDHNSFFQAWLFFGLIHEFLGANLDEFIDHKEQRVTTARLPYWAAKWQQSQPIFSRSKRLAECERVNKCLREVRDTITWLDSRKRRQQNFSHLSEEVGVSIIVLGLTLENVKLYFNGWSPSGGMKDEDRLSMKVAGWPTSEFARKRLETAGWCKSEVSRLEMYMFSSGMLYCGSMPSFGRIIDHSRCSEDRCAAENINEETYETAHAEGCNGCKHDGPEVRDLEAVLDKERFPVIGLTKSETSDVCISILPHHKWTAYTAITHVWADGLGNPRGNTLPKCQILRLYQLLQSHSQTRWPAWMRRFSSLETNTVYLWIDTLCIPLDKKFRKKAISLMYDVYSKATTVLVLDRSLLSISAERPTEELCFRITASPWMRRAWTLQEGALAKSLSVQFADRALHTHQVMESLFKRSKGTKTYSITLEESCSAIFYLNSYGDNKDPSQLSDVLRGLTHRSTSHPEDKLICFAIMIRCDMDRIMKVKGDRRTQQVYQQLKYIPSGFLWHNSPTPRPTLDIPGFRWAPKNIFSVGGGTVEDGLALSDRGLLVVAHGMVYFGPSQYMPNWTMCIRDFTTHKWYNLRWLAKESFNGAAVQFDTPWTTLAIILRPNMTLNPASQSGVVIRLDWNLSMATPDPQGLSNYIRRCDTISGEYMGRANLEELNQTEGNQFEQQKEVLEERLVDISQFMFKGEMRGSEQKWCVT